MPAGRGGDLGGEGHTTGFIYGAPPPGVEDELASLQVTLWQKVYGASLPRDAD